MATKQIKQAQTTKAARGAKGAGDVSPATKAADARREALRNACIVALSVATHSAELRQGKQTLSGMLDNLRKLGVNADVVKQAREAFGVTFCAIHGLPVSAKSQQKPATGLARELVATMAEVGKLDPTAYAAAKNKDERKALTQRLTKALQRMAPSTGNTTKPADIYEAAASWAKRAVAQFENFKIKSMTDPAFKRLTQVLFDELTGVGK